MKIKIKCRFSESVLFSHEAEGNTVKLTVKAAVMARANLSGANLAGAYLDRAYMAGAYMAGANLAGANLDGAYLAGGKTLKGERPILQIGPIGSRCDYFVAYITDKGLFLRAGCFFGSASEFSEKVTEEHCNNKHAQEYAAAMNLIETHAAMWTPSVEAHEQQPETEASA